MHATQQGRNRQNLSSPSVQVCVRAYARPWPCMPCTSPSSNNRSIHRRRPCMDTSACTHAGAAAGPGRPAGTYVVCAIVRQRQIRTGRSQKSRRRRIDTSSRSPHRIRSHDSMHVFARHARRHAGPQPRVQCGFVRALRDSCCAATSGKYC